MRAATLAALLAAACLCLPQATRATADGPDHWRLAGAAQAGGVSLRAAPSEEAQPLAEIPPGTDGLPNLGCIGGLSYVEWEAADSAAREAARLSRWCRTGIGETIGWAPGWLLEEGDGPSALNGAVLFALDGTGWEVTWIGGAALDWPEGERPFVQFSDGTAAGASGCNQFTGGYQTHAGKLAIGPLASTRMLCEDWKNDAEMQVLSALGSAESFAGSQLHLALFGPDGDVLVRFRRRYWN